MKEYYSQRASAGLIITEATMIARDGCAFTGEGGIFDDECVAGWRAVTDAVHARGGLIIVQLWHPGRAAHSVLNGGVQPISSTDRAIRGDTIHTPEGTKEYERPRRLAREELPGIVELFRAGAVRALEAGFDGAQLHGAHGYLLDQFLRDGTNDRTDEYGGPIERRARLLLEATDAVVAELGASRVSVRISPCNAYNDMVDSDPGTLVRYVASELSRRGLSFLELRHSDHARPQEAAIRRIAREHFSGPLFVNGGYDLAAARETVASGSADAVVFGTSYVSNPDLVERFARGRALNKAHSATFYTPGAAGYTDYPFDEGHAESK
jgi:N-ethylmaleimide reductase